MNKAGVMRIGAMLAVLTVLAGGFAALPYWTASAGDKSIFGFVQECGSNPPNYLDGVTVTLVDAHAILQPQTYTTTGGGLFDFNPNPANYFLELSFGGYYKKETGPFRFDGSTNLREDTCLIKMPDRDTTLRVLVVDQQTNLHPDELVDFAHNFVPFEDAGARFYQNASGNFTQVSKSPLWYRTNADFRVQWRSSTLSYPGQYNWYNPFNGTMRIFDSVVSSDLSLNHRYLNVTYWFSSTTAQLAFPPVVPGTVTVKKGGIAWGVENTDWKLDVNTGVITILRDFLFGTDKLTVTYQSSGALPNSAVNLFDMGQKQVVSSGLTNGTGWVTFPIWKATLELQVSRDLYQPFTLDVNTNGTNFTRVILVKGIVITGHVFRSDTGRPIMQGVVGYLYNTNPAIPTFKRVIAANVSFSSYRFAAEAGQTYKMVIDADGFTAATRTITFPVSNPVDISLALSDKEVYRTTATYAKADWNTLRVSRNLTLRSDSTISALKLAEIRSLDLQIDYNFGTSTTTNGVRDPTEETAFKDWLLARLPSHVTTDNFLTTNGAIYNSTNLSKSVSINWNAEGGEAIWINTSAIYPSRVTTPLPNLKPVYYVNVSTPNDRNESVYQDQVVVVDLPKGYEMTEKKVTGPITTTGWTVVTVDPGVGGPTPSTIEMTVRVSRNGTARAMVTGPSGKFYVLDDTVKNYSAVVAANTNITFSAEQSTDPVGNIRDANFTWRFTNNTNPNLKRFGITSTFNYTPATLGRYDFVVNLTVQEAGGNYTYRDIKVYVDDIAPIANIKTNRTGTGIANNTLLRIDERTPIKWDASSSTDGTYPGATWLDKWKNHIPDVDGSRWDFEGDHTVDSRQRVVVHAFDKPGYYNATLQVVDWVGHTSIANATLHVIANDTTKPTPNFLILDRSKDWSVTSALVEGKQYYFNASTSTDNFDDNKNLSYAWHFPGNANCTPDCSNGGNIPSQRGPLGWNVTVMWAVFNVSYNVTLNVTDRGFGPNPKGPNWANLTTSVHVAVDVAKHPDLKYVSQSLKIEPANPEEGQSINVSFIIENIANRADAMAVTITLTAKDPNGAVVPVSGAGSPGWYDANWNPASNKTIASGKRVHIVFSISFPAQGNKSIEIRFHDALEPYTWVDSQNRVTGSLFVKLAGWVVPAAIIGFIAAVIAVAFGARTWSRYRSGELVFRRKEKKEKKKLKDEPEEEELEPAEDTKGKKRL